MDLLQSLRPDDRADLEGLAVHRHYRTGTTVFCEGDPSDSVIVIERGQGKVTCVGDDGKDVLLSLVGDGEIVGELAGLDGGVRSATLTILDPADVLVIRGDTFASYLATHPSASRMLLSVLARRLRQADQRAVEFATLGVSGRLCRRLTELIEVWGERSDDGAVEVRFPLSHDELAGWTASSREAVTKALAELRKDGLVETQRRRIVVLDAAEVRRRSRAFG